MNSNPCFVNATIPEVSTDKAVFKDVSIAWKHSGRSRQTFSGARWITGYEQLSEYEKDRVGKALDERFTESEAAELCHFLSRVAGMEPTVEVVQSPLQALHLLELAGSIAYTEFVGIPSEYTNFNYSFTDRADYDLPFSIVGECHGEHVGLIVDGERLRLWADFVQTILERVAPVDRCERSEIESAIKDLAAKGDFDPYDLISKYETLPL